MNKIEEAIRKRGLDKKQLKRPPLWDGPESDTDSGGITFSMLSRFLVCRERFRLSVVEGLRPTPQFEPRLEFGSMWHACEEGFAAEPDTDLWKTKLVTYISKLVKDYPLQREDIDRWGRTVMVMFPHYIKFWYHHKDTAIRTPLLQEQVFNVPYPLPSGRVVRLRGKWDAVEIVGPQKAIRGAGPRKGGAGAGIYLVENKTKGEINPDQIVRQMQMDLQTMLYMVALEIDRARDHMESHLAACEQTDPLSFNRQVPIRGVRYNVVKRPRHYPGKKESLEQFMVRLGEEVVAEDPASFFMRWEVIVTPNDITRFRRCCLDPLLEQVCDWWQWVSAGQSFAVNTSVGGVPWYVHWIHPFGVRNILDEGGATDLDNYIITGSEMGLVRAAGLFGELQ